MDNKSSICRICVEEKTSLQLLSDVNVECHKLFSSICEILKILAGFEVVDCTSQYICAKCIEHATISYKFKVLCDESNEKYKKYSEMLQTLKVETSSLTNLDVVKEEVQLSDDDLPLSYFTCDVTLSDNDVKETNSEILKCEIEEVQQDNNQIITTNKQKHVRKKQIHDNFWNDNFIFCKFCNKVFKNKYVLIAHEKRHENKGKFVCDDCSKAFDSKGCLTRHIKIVHTGEKKFKCEECQRCFSSSNNLRLHSRRHSGIKPYLCTQCGKSFSHPTGLSYHVKTHTRIRPYTCEICGKNFLMKGHLDRHTKIHTGERPFVCKQCDRGFIKKIDLQRHEQTHSGERPHICKICNKSFLRVLHLNYHMMVHTSERPHRCSYCGKGFIRRYYLTSHMKKQHAENLVEETGSS